MKFRKKPVIVEAVQFEGTLNSLIAFAVPEASQQLGIRSAQIHTLEGVMTALPGDWIIRGIKGEIYPCKPDIFAATYEPADQQPAPGAAHPGYSAMQPHQQRVVDEQAELDDRWKKLGAFFGSEAFADLDEEERSRLRQQFHAMTSYSAILGERIAAFAPA